MRQVSEMIELLESRGRRRYGGEPVSRLEHALQAAQRAERAGAPDWLIVAALLHDVGHLLDPREPAPGDDGHHERLGARFAAPRLGRPIARVIALHVKAKRYLCAIDPGYREALSPASARSLILQGGPLAPMEVEAFERLPYHREAVQLRRWDDEAKVPGLATSDLGHHRSRLEDALRRATAAD